MPWTSAVQTVDQTEYTPLPDSERIRREALQRSWQRDRKVSARRLRVRWTIWALCRYGLPLLFVLGTAVAVWTWGLPQLRKALSTLTDPVASPTVHVQPANVPLAPPTPPTAPIEPPVALPLPPVGEPASNLAAPAPPEPGAGEQDPIQLRREVSFPSSIGELGQASPEATDSPTTPNPVLKPDIGMQNKEP